MQDADPAQRFEGSGQRVGAAQIGVEGVDPQAGQQRIEYAQGDAAGQVLRHVGDAPAAFADAQRGQRLAVEAELTAYALQPRETAQEGRLAGAVGANQRGEGAAFQFRQGHLVDHRVAAVSDRQVLREQAHAWRPPRQTSTTNTGTPTSAVTMPTGTISPGISNLLATDDSDSSSAPTRALAGR